jgi:hypothetical protein
MEVSLQRIRLKLSSVRVLRIVAILELETRLCPRRVYDLFRARVFKDHLRYREWCRYWIKEGIILF